MSGVRKYQFGPSGEKFNGNRFSLYQRVGVSQSKKVLFLAAWILFGCSSYAMAFQGGMEPEPPYAADDWVETNYDVPTYCGVLVGDFGSMAPIDPTSISIATPPSFGTVVVDTELGDVLYIPDPGFVGLDMFEYTVSDTDGLGSNVAGVYVDVINFDPEIINFMVSEGPDDVWFFEGSVIDENVSTVTISFGGLLEGESTSVNADGTFSFHKQLNNGESGPVTAVAIDEVGAESQDAYDEVFRP